MLRVHQAKGAIELIEKFKSESTPAKPALNLLKWVIGKCGQMKKEDLSCDL